MTRNGNNLTDEPGVLRRRVLEASAVLSGGALASETAVGSPAGERDARGAASDTADLSGTLECGDTVTEELTAEDDPFFGEQFTADFYRLESVDTEYLTIAMETVVDYETGVYPEPILYLLDADGAVIASGSREYSYDDDTEYVYSQISAFQPPEEGPYTVVATTQYPENYFEYTLAVDCVSLDPAGIECGESVSGTLRNDDPSGLVGRNRHFDAYAFEGTSGQVAEISVETPNPNDPGGPNDPRLGNPVLYLLGPNGQIVARADGFLWTEYNTALRHYLQRDGRYTIVVTSFGPNDEFEYDLTLECMPIPEAESIPCGETISGALTADDPESIFARKNLQDLYQFQGTAGDEVTITLDGIDPFVGSDMQLYLIGPSGAVVAQSGDGTGQSTLLIRVLSRTGTYRIAVVSDSYYLTYADELGYDLGLVCDPSPQRCEITAEERLECGSRVVDELDGTDSNGFRGPRHLQDVYCFDAQEGETVTVSMTVAEPGYQAPYLYILGPEGEIVAEYSDRFQYLDRSSTASIREYTVERGGTHKIVATSRWEADLFEYSLLLQCEGQ